MNLRLVRFIDIYIGIPLIYICYWIKKIFRSENKQSVGSNYKKILLIKFWGIGNVAMLLPAGAALKGKYPGVEIDFLTLLSNKNVAKAAGIFNNIYLIDNKKFPAFLKTSINTFLLLRHKNYDAIIDFEQFARFSALFCLLIKGGKTIGFSTLGQHRHFSYTQPVTYDNCIHMTKSYFSLAEAAGIVPCSATKPVPLQYGRHDVSEAEKMLRKINILKDDLLIVMHSGTSENFIERRWPAEYYTELANRLIENFGVKVAFTGVKEESTYIEIIRKGIRYVEHTIDLSRDLSFGRYLAIIILSDLVISADTASVHLASCMSIPVVGIYGPNTPLLYGPWGERSIWCYKQLACSPCITNYNTKINKCKNPEGRGACMKNISADEVFSVIKKHYFDKDAPFKLKKLYG